jgi:hypothetical protein
VAPTIFLNARETTAQTIRVDVAPGKALAFDRDKAMGTSMSIFYRQGSGRRLFPAFGQGGFVGRVRPIT